MAILNFLGTFRLVHRDSNDNTIAELTEKLAAEFGDLVEVPAAVTTFSDPQMMPKVKKGLSTVMKQDDKLVVMVKPAIDQVAGAANIITVRIPVTFRNERSGVVYEKTLNYADFVSYWDEATRVISPAMSAGIWYDFLVYTIPAQSEMKLGHSIQDVRVDSAMVMNIDLT